MLHGPQLLEFELIYHMSFQCPSCGKDGFKTHDTVACHMSQPHSGCNTWIDDLIQLKSHMSLEDDPIGLQSHNFGPHVSHKHNHGVQFNGGLDLPAGGTWSNLEGSGAVQPEHSEEGTQEIVDYFQALQRRTEWVIHS
ncbi:hypothetical protein DFH29DRAFT_1008886 [Suillus ampliporus]|nr:hypothetical protein DFH29DRAFT_1008886 [Suillus ampliporus]